MDLSKFLIISTKCYCSLVCKIHKIFTQMETNFNEKVVSKLIRKSFRRLKQRTSIHFILTNYENSVILTTTIFRPLK